jgi:hypothetical protein
MRFSKEQAVIRVLRCVMRIDYLFGQGEESSQEWHSLSVATLVTSSICDLLSSKLRDVSTFADSLYGRLCTLIPVAQNSGLVIVVQIMVALLLSILIDEDEKLERFGSIMRCFRAKFNNVSVPHTKVQQDPPLDDDILGFVVDFICSRLKAPESSGRETLESMLRNSKRSYVQWQSIFAGISAMLDKVIDSTTGLEGDLPARFRDRGFSSYKTAQGVVGANGNSMRSLFVFLGYVVAEKVQSPLSPVLVILPWFLLLAEIHDGNWSNRCLKHSTTQSPKSSLRSSDADTSPIPNLVQCSAAWRRNLTAQAFRR